MAITYLNDEERLQALITRRVKLIGSTTRLRILRLLETQEGLSVVQIADLMEMSQPGVTHQLLKLSNVGFIECREGQFHRYYVNKDMVDRALKEVAHYLEL